METEDGPSAEEAEALGQLVGRGMAEAMKSEDFAVLERFLARELPGRLGEGGLGEPAAALRSLVSNVARIIWNATPLPSEGFRPRSLPAPERNQPCPCGSGQKFKRCCGRFAPAFPAIAPEESWAILASQMDAGETERLFGAPGLPLGALAPLAERLRDLGRSDRALRFLRKALDAEPVLDERHGDAVLLHLELDAQLNGLSGAFGRVEQVLPRLPRAVRGRAYESLVTAAGDEGDFDAAWRFLDEARRETPDSPDLGQLEVMLCLAQDELARASERARFWLARIRRRGLAGEMKEAVELLEQVARDPEAARGQLIEDRVVATPIFAAELRPLVAAACSRLVRPYPVDVAGDGVTFDQPPEGVRAIEAGWARVWRAEKPLLTSLDIDPPVETFRQPRRWLDYLRRRPAAFDSLHVLDDLTLVLAPLAEVADPGLDASLAGPLLDRALAIVRASLERHPAARVEWGFLANRPVLRLLTQAALRLDRRGQGGEAASLFEWMLRLNPSDNHAHRGWLVNHYLKVGADERALAVARHHSDDILPDTLYGQALALWRLDRREEAERALRAAAEDLPRVARALTARTMREPEMHPLGIEMGGENEAWLYREAMLETWKATPGVRELLATVALPDPRPRRRPRRSVAGKRSGPA